MRVAVERWLDAFSMKLSRPERLGAGSLGRAPAGDGGGNDST